MLINFFRIRTVIFLTALVSTNVLNLSCSIQSDDRPNIVFVLADDLGWADLPLYGNKFNEAPKLDQLASEGMRFTNAYAAGPVCSPTRASIMSGQYPARIGIIDFIRGHWRPYEKVIVPQNRTQYLPLEVITIAEALKSSGYATGYFGKWHLGNEEKYHPLNQGFDIANVGTKYYGEEFSPPRPHDPNRRLSELLTDFGIEFIEKNKDNPFFLFIAHFDVHVQLDANVDLIKRYKEKQKVDGYPCNVIYAAMIEHLDRSVGRINDKLKELGLDENTLFIFFSDNGGLRMRGDKGPLIAQRRREIYEGDSLLYIATENTPLRREKGTLYEGGVREPMIVKWPAKIKPGSTSNSIVFSVDFFPTLVSVAGGNLPENQVFDGKNIVPVFTGDKEMEERTIFWHYPVYHHDIPASAVRSGDWKLIHNLVDSGYQLYNLKEDISEMNNLSDVYPEKQKELSKMLNQWRTEVDAEFPVTNPDFDMERRFELGRHP